MRRASGGYALIAVAIAVVFLAVVTGTIVHQAASGNISTVMDLQQSQASSVAMAGVAWAIAQSPGAVPAGSTRAFGGGTFTITANGRVVRAEGKSGDATRVVEAERTLYYVPDSRFDGLDANASLELVNLTGGNLDVTGITVEFAGGAFYEGVKLFVFGESPSAAFPGGAPAVDYGTVATWTSGGRRFGSGETVSFGAARRIGDGRQVALELLDFRSAPTGTPGAVDMDAQPLRVTFRTAAGPLAGVAVPKATP